MIPCVDNGRAYMFAYEIMSETFKKKKPSGVIDASVLSLLKE